MMARMMSQICVYQETDACVTNMERTGWDEEDEEEATSEEEMIDTIQSDPTECPSGSGKTIRMRQVG